MYCTECGTKLITKVVGAEKLLEGIGESDWSKYYKYNEETGQRQYLKMRFCPNKRVFNFGHDEYFVDKLVTK